VTAQLRRRLRVALLVAIAVLYGLSVPWYRAGGSDTGTLWGLPTWVTVAVACYGIVAVLNALAWWLTEIPDHPEDGD